MSSVTEKAVKNYKTVCKVPQVLGGRLLEGGNRAVIDVKQRNLSMGDFENYQLTLDTGSSTENFVVGNPVPVGNAVTSVSPSGSKQVSISTSSTDSKQQILSVCYTCSFFYCLYPSFL